MSNFRKIRNSVVHELRSVTQSEAKSILEYVHLVLESMIVKDAAPGENNAANGV